MNTNVRTFRAPDPRAALDAVKAALGEDAVILNTREVGGGLWGKREIEVTAARPGHAAEATTGDRDEQVAALRRIVEELRAEVRASRAEPRMSPGRGLPPEGARLCRRLVDRGVEESLAEPLVKQALAQAASPRDEDLLEAVRALVRKRLPPARPPWEGAERRVVALVGPTGVGKTTTIAKIAARALLERRLKVSLVTVDTYRIGASEHISRYGEIMGVPVHVARDASALRQAITRSADAQLILVDTAGRWDQAALAAQADLLRAIPELETHLVLSAASGARELRAAAKRYLPFGVDRLVFSKIDEAVAPGSVLSASEAMRPISCLTDGQRVPDDLHAVTGPILVDTVVGS